MLSKNWTEQVEMELAQRELKELKDKIEMLIHNNKCDLLPGVYEIHQKAFKELRQSYTVRGLIKPEGN